MPIINEITQSKTIDFLTKSLESDHIFLATQQNLNKIKSVQISPRLSLYKTFKSHLDTLL